MYNGVNIESPILLQVLGGRRILGHSSQKEVFRLLVSDGKYQYGGTVLASQLNDLYTNDLLTDFTVIRVNNYISSETKMSSDTNIKAIIFIDLEVIVKGEDVQGKIHSPIALESAIHLQQETEAMHGNARQNIDDPSAQASNTDNGNTTEQSVHPTSSNAVTDRKTKPINSLSPYQNR